MGKQSGISSTAARRAAKPLCSMQNFVVFWHTKLMGNKRGNKKYAEYRQGEKFQILTGGKRMEIKMENIGTTLVVKVAGEIDHHTAPELKDEIDREINLRNIINLVLDFDGVSFMDSSGIGVLIGRYKQIQARGGRTMVIRVRPQVDKILEISGLKKILDCSH